MTKVVVLPVDPSKDLDFINNTVIPAEEKTAGPLSGMGNDGSVTQLTFNWGPAPKANARVAEQVGGSPVTPAGSSPVCTGTIFVSGKLTLCSASRPN
jgi:hypothetical protein